MNKRTVLFILLAFLILISTPLPSHGVTPTGPALQLTVNLHSIRAINAQGVTALVTQVHSDIRGQVQQKLSLSEAVMQEKNLLETHPDVQSVVQLPGDNLFVRFKDNNELVMLMGEDRRGSGGTAPTQTQLAQSAVTQSQPFQTEHPKILRLPPPRPFPLPCIPGAMYALIFDALADDGNAANPSDESISVASSLTSLGYSITNLKNDLANLLYAASIGQNANYFGVIFMSGHGGVMNGNDFIFLVRPWYADYPPENTNYLGTVRCSAFSIKYNKVMFAYAITGTFAQTYWKKKFPSTLFFLDSCHGTDPAGLPGMATYVLTHGAYAWVGWSPSVSFTCANRETKDFFSQMALEKKIGDALNYVSQKNNYCPALALVPASASQCKLGKWYVNTVNRQEVPSGDRVRAVQVHSDGSTLYVRVTFWSEHLADNDFLIYVNAVGGNGAKLQINCQLNDFQVWKASASNVYDTLLFHSVPETSTWFITNNDQYLVGIPWSETFGNATSASLRVFTAVGGPQHDYLPANALITLNR